VGGRLDSPNITTLDQAAALPNVKIAAYAGSSAYDAVVNYNASHTNKFIVESAAFLQQFNGIGDGSIDALIGEQSSLTSYNNFSNTERYAGTAWNSATQKGYDFKILAPNEPIFTETFHYLLGKTKTELKTAVDGAIKELKAAGTLDEIYTANQNKPR
jgi:ABC-type amino acid transport substrate-binding protein